MRLLSACIIHRKRTEEVGWTWLRYSVSLSFIFIPVSRAHFCVDLARYRPTSVRRPISQDAILLSDVEMDLCTSIISFCPGD